MLEKLKIVSLQNGSEFEFLISAQFVIYINELILFLKLNTIKSKIIVGMNCSHFHSKKSKLFSECLISHSCY